MSAGSPFDDLDRPPLRPAALARALVVPGGLWREIRVLDQTGSTNADLVAAARTGERDGLVIVAEAQTAGRGRLGRDWTTPPRSALTFSMLLRPQVDSDRWVWLPLLTAVATSTAVAQVARIEVSLKWPNDVQHAGGKLAGILVERVDSPRGAAAVVGVGLNVSQKRHELPVPAATSLALAAAAGTDREPVLRAILREFAGTYGQWVESNGDPDLSGVRAAYLARCETVGRQVSVELPDGQALDGQAVDIDRDGRLVISREGRLVTVAAGDVVHARSHGDS